MLSNVLFMVNCLLLGMMVFSLILAAIGAYLHLKEDEYNYKKSTYIRKPHVPFWKRKSIIKRRNENDKQN